MGKHPVFDTIMARRSIRQFKDIAVSEDDITTLLTAAMAAPSACNLQPWAFVVVDEPCTLEKLKKTMPQGDYNAPLAIVVCGISKHIPWDDEGGWRQDCGGAAQNIMLEAVELGLGSVCVGGFDEDELKSLLCIPDDVEPMCVIELGYPDYERDALSWYTEEAVHRQRYDSAKPRTLRTIEMLQEDIAAGKM